MAKKKSKKAVKKNAKKSRKIKQANKPTTKKAKKKVAKKKQKSKKKAKTKRKPNPIIVKEVEDLSLVKLTRNDILVMRIERKRLAVKKLVPEIPCSGTDELEGESIPYTEAEVVREKYYTAFEEVGLTVCTYAEPGLAPQMMFQNRQFAILGYYKITDVDTGYSVIAWGFGVGANYDWAGNTAQTRAMKQFMLSNFMGNWKDPSNQQIKAVRREVQNCDVTEFINSTSGQIAEKLGDYFEASLTEKKKKGGK